MIYQSRPKEDRVSNHRYRSSITGRFVKLAYALKHPRVTVRELLKKK